MRALRSPLSEEVRPRGDGSKVSYPPPSSLLPSSPCRSGYLVFLIDFLDLLFVVVRHSSAVHRFAGCAAPISGGGPHAQTRAGTGCRPRGLIFLLAGGPTASPRIVPSEFSHTRALDVADDAAGLVVHELDADLGDTTARTGAAEDAGDLDQLDGLLRGIHFEMCGVEERKGCVCVVVVAEKARKIVDGRRW